MKEMNDSGMDLSKIVGLIMENPGIIAQISELVRKGEPEPSEEMTEPNPITEQTRPTEQAPAAAAPRESQRERRAALLCALKPYVSEKRAQAIDSMLTITEMIELMKAR